MRRRPSAGRQVENDGFALSAPHRVKTHDLLWEQGEQDTVAERRASKNTVPKSVRCLVPAPGSLTRLFHHWSPTLSSCDRRFCRPGEGLPGTDLEETVCDLGSGGREQQGQGARGWAGEEGVSLRISWYEGASGASKWHFQPLS